MVGKSAISSVNLRRQLSPSPMDNKTYAIRMQAIITHRSEVSKKTERHRRKCLEQMYFALSEMHVHNITLESRQETQNRRDVAHIVALQGQVTGFGF